MLCNEKLRRIYICICMGFLLNPDMRQTSKLNQEALGVVDVYIFI